MDLWEFRSAVLVLRALADEGGSSTAQRLCDRTGVSRDTLDGGLRSLVRHGLALRGTRRFGRPVTVALTEQGTKAARLAGGLISMLADVGPIVCEVAAREKSRSNRSQRP